MQRGTSFIQAPFKLIYARLNSFRLIQARSSSFELIWFHLSSFKIISSHASLAKILFRLNLTPLIFNIFLKDLLLNNLRSFVVNFTDTNTLYRGLKIVSGWFRNNQIIIIPGKFQLMLHGKRKSVKIENERIKLE